MRNLFNLTIHLEAPYLLPLCLLFIIVVSSCNVNKYLEEDEYFLEYNKIDIEEGDSDLSFREKNRLDNQLYTRLRQEPNSYFLWVPRQWFHYKIAREKDTSGIQNFLLKYIAEQPVLLSREVSIRTASDMANYMRSEGYFKPDARFSFDTTGNKGSVTYTAYPGKRWTVDSLFYESPDTAVLSILKNNRNNTYLKPGAPISESLYSQELDRVSKLLRNRGYAEFYPDYIEPLEIDTFGSANKVYFEVTTPPGAPRHEVFRNDDIHVWLNESPEAPDSTVLSDTLDRIVFYSAKDRFEIKPPVLSKNIYLRRGELYSEEDYDQTIRQLGKLGILKYPNLKQSLDTTGSPRSNYDIYLRTNPKYSWQTSIELFYSNISQYNLLGISGSVGLTDRNAFRGAEEWSVGMEGSVELGLGQSELNTYYFSANSNLLIPTYKPVFGFLKGLDRLNIGKKKVLNKSFYKDFQREANTRIALSFDFASVQNLYDYYSLSSSYGYEYTKGRMHSFEINQLGLNYWNPTIGTAFREIIGENEFFLQSFSDRLFTGIFLRDFTYNFQKPTNRFGERYRLYGNFELSGLEVLAVNALYNGLTDNNKQFKLSGSEIEFSKFLRAEVDGRYNKRITSRTSWAARINLGIAVPFGPDQTVPYIKQFLIGGPYSIRAWQSRELGPGEFRDTSSRDRNQPFYQKGDFKLEMNVEYRFDLFWLLEGAVFVDAGNVWNLKESHDDHIQTALHWDFYTQLAVGTGFGFRFDFSYVLVRLDFGYRLRTPYPDENGKHWSFQKEENFALGDLQLQVGLDYPF